MTAAILYRPTPRWRFGLALAAAALVHLSAVAFAKRSAPEPASVAAPQDGGEIYFVELPDTPPPPVAEEVAAPPLATASEDEFTADEKRPPAPLMKHRPATTPLVRSKGRSSAPVASLANRTSAKVQALSAPRLQYPYEARRQRVTGSGVALVTIDSTTGAVLAVAMSQSTGSVILDNAATSGFRRWRFRPGTASKVAVPITFTLSGVAY